MIPHAVDPAQPPMNIKNKKKIKENFPHKPKSSVTSPVPDDAIVMAAFEPLAEISFVVTEPAVRLLTSRLPALTEMAPDLSAAVAVVVPKINESVSSFQSIAALSPADPLSIMIPALLRFADAPVFNSIMLSSMVVFVVLTVVDVPPTVKLPVTLTFKLSRLIVLEPEPEL